MKTQRIAWEWVGLPGREDVVLHSDADALIAEGEVSGTFEENSIRLLYRLACTPDWRFCSADLRLAAGAEERACRVVHRPDGVWEVDGEPRPDLAHCSAIDIMVTPLTNTLPIRSLAFTPGVPVRLSVAYVPVPSLAVVPREQEYTLLSPGRFRYRSLETDFTAELEVDGDGLVLRYGDIWRRA